MQYILLIYSDESRAPEPPDTREGWDAYMAPWARYGAALAESGAMQGANALQATSTSTTVTATGGSGPVFTDGPFAETKEQLGGYYLLECKDMDEALGWAAKCPGAQHGRVEVRPIMDLNPTPA